MAAPARYVVALSGTLTGSIGVTGGKVVTTGALQKASMNREAIYRGEAAPMEAGYQPYTEDERRKVWDFINNIYDHFLTRVSSSRGKTREEIDAVGGGRVWTGRQAVDHGLVDEVGTLDRAIAKARELAKLPSWAPVREVRVGKRAVPPVPTAAGALEYALEGVRLLNSAPALAMMPWVADKG